MKLCTFIGLILFPGLLWCITPTYGLEECIDLALKNNPTIKKNQYIIHQYEYQVKRARASFFPTINLSGRYSHSYSDSTGLGENNYSVSLNLNQLLFNGLQRWNDYVIAKLEKEKVMVTYTNSRQELIYNVKAVYYQLLLFENQLNVWKKIIDRRKQDLALIKLKYDSGKEKLSSVKVAEASQQESQYNQLEKTEEIKLSKIKLNLFMNQPADNDLSVKEIDDHHKELNYPEVIQKIRTKYPQLNTAELDLKISEKNLDSTRGEYFPDFNLTGSYGLSDDTFFPQNKSWNIGLSVSIPLFAGFSTSHKINEMKYKLKSQKEGIREIQNELDIKFFDLLSSYSLLQKKVKVQSAKYDSAYESYRIINLEYKQGLTSYDWLQQKETELSQLELENEQLKYNMRVILAEINKYLTE
ncbi:MAG: TolC family protein [Spirochaetes bacterium]|nr:TolC family protein [Spirochaetota bacterium]